MACITLRAEDAARPDIEELLKVTRMEKVAEHAVAQAQKMVAYSLKQSGNTAAMPSFMTKYNDLLKEQLSWGKMKPEYARLFAEIYTPDEVKQLLAFYESPTGQMLLDKQPVLLEKTTEMTQRMMAEWMPKIQAMLKASQVEKARNATGADFRAGGLSGRYVLAERPVGVQLVDVMEFHQDGTCLLDMDAHTGVTGKYETSADGQLKIETGTGMGSPTFTGSYKLNKYTLVFSLEGMPDLYYVQWAAGGDHPPFSEVTGIFDWHTENGDGAGEITDDYKFKERIHGLTGQHRYYDISVDGACTYVDGVVTYNIRNSNSPRKDAYMRDFVLKRDNQGLWVVDFYRDTPLCETPAKDMELPPVPAGYTKEEPR